MSIHPDDLPPVWDRTTETSPLGLALAFVVLLIGVILLAMSPALVIAVWRWAL
jgi:hypothetical protein